MNYIIYSNFTLIFGPCLPNTHVWPMSWATYGPKKNSIHSNHLNLALKSALKAFS